MATTSVVPFDSAAAPLRSGQALDRVLEQHNIHAATCRARKQALVCGTCTELLEKLIRACRAHTAALVAARGAAHSTRSRSLRAS